MRVVIVGAGIAGLAAAKGLRLIGCDVEIYEQAPALEPVGAGISLSENALNALDVLGLCKRVAVEAQPIHRIELLDKAGKLLHAAKFPGSDGNSAHLQMVALHRGDLHQALFSALPGLSIHTGMECVGAQQTGNKVQLAFANEERIEADLVLACDGVHSAIRRAIFPEARERFAHYACWRAVVQGSDLPIDHECLTETWGPGRRFGIAALPEDRVYWFACCGSERMNDPGLAKIEISSLRALFAEFHHPIPEVLSKTSPEALIWTDIVDLAPLVSFVRGRVVLLGDAAHAVTPDLGQGACLAIEDAAVITAQIGRHGLDTALRQYDARRVARAHRIAAASRFYAAVAQWRHPVLVGLRNHLVRSTPAKFLDWQLSSILDHRFEPVLPAAP
jgi:2-polyprenyl-6-methoxyphenol hydroxylase-like FAD-dependent oxidoreductase